MTGASGPPFNTLVSTMKQEVGPTLLKPMRAAIFWRRGFCKPFIATQWPPKIKGAEDDYFFCDLVRSSLQESIHLATTRVEFGW